MAQGKAGQAIDLAGKYAIDTIMRRYRFGETPRGVLRGVPPKSRARPPLNPSAAGLCADFQTQKSRGKFQNGDQDRAWCGQGKGAVGARAAVRAAAQVRP